MHVVVMGYVCGGDGGVHVVVVVMGGALGGGRGAYEGADEGRPHNVVSLYH